MIVLIMTMMLMTMMRVTMTAMLMMVFVILVLMNGGGNSDDCGMMLVMMRRRHPARTLSLHTILLANSQMQTLPRIPGKGPMRSTLGTCWPWTSRLAEDFM